MCQLYRMCVKLAQFVGKQPCVNGAHSIGMDFAIEYQHKKSNHAQGGFWNMNYDKFTEKSREAFGEAQQMAAKMNHQELTGLHLLAALLKQTDGPVCSMLSRLNVDLKALNNEID